MHLALFVETELSKEASNAMEVIVAHLLANSLVLVASAELLLAPVMLLRLALALLLNALQTQSLVLEPFADLLLTLAILPNLAMAVQSLALLMLSMKARLASVAANPSLKHRWATTATLMEVFITA